MANIKRKTILEIKARSKNASKNDKQIMIEIINKAIIDIEQHTQNRILINSRIGDDLEDE